EPEFTDVALRLTVGLGKQDHSGSSTGSAAIRFQLRRYMTSLRAGRFAARLVEKADLHRIVTVALVVANKQHGTRAGLQHRDGSQLARFIVNLRHSHLQAEQA